MYDVRIDVTSLIWAVSPEGFKWGSWSVIVDTAQTQMRGHSRLVQFRPFPWARGTRNVREGGGKDLATPGLWPWRWDKGGILQEGRTRGENFGDGSLSRVGVLKAEDLEVYTMEVEETKTKKEEE